jgi:hypothetical protein
MADGPITLDASEVEEAPTLDASQVEEAAPKQYLPEVNRAVASVPKPPNVLDVAAAYPGTLPTHVPKNWTGKPVQTPGIGVPEVASAATSLLAPGTVMPGQLETSPAESVGQGVRELGTPGKRVTGALRTTAGALDAAAPLAGPLAVENPLTFARAMGEGYVGGKAAKYGTKAVGGTEEQQGIAEDIGQMAPMLVHAAVRPEVGVETTPEGTRVAGTVAGGRAGAGIAVTPEAVTVRGKVGPLEGSKTFQRGAKAAGPVIEAPTIEGQVATPSRADIAEHLDRTNFESPEAAKASYVAEKQAQEPTGEAKPKAPEAEVIPPPKPAPAVKETPAVPVLEANQVEEVKPTALPKEEPSVKPGGTKLEGSRPAADEPVAKPGPESAPVVAKPGVEETAATPSKEQPAEKPEIVKGGKVELAKDTVVGNRVIPAGTSVTIRYADPNGLAVRAETEDGTKIVRAASAFKASVDAGKTAGAQSENPSDLDARAQSQARGNNAGKGTNVDSEVEGSALGRNEVQARRSAKEPALAGSEGQVSSNEAVEGVGQPTTEIGRIRSRDDRAGGTIGAPGRNGEQVGASVTSLGARPPQESRPNGQPRGESGSTVQRGTPEDPFPSAEGNEQIREGHRSPGTVGNEVGSLPSVPNRSDSTQRAGDVRNLLRGIPTQAEAPRTPAGRLLTPEELDVQNQPGTTGVAKDVDKWQPPPELGAFPNVPDIGSKVRAKNPEPTRAEVKAARIAPEPTHTDMERSRLGLPPEPGRVGEMNTRDLKVAPNKFQYKLSTDAEGVGTLLKETKVFNPDLAGVISVWKDPVEGKTYVVNGHHRYELAKRTGQKTVTIRHIVAKDATTARAIGALQNIAEGRGTALDAAKFFRDSGLTPEQLKEKGISLGEKTASDGLAMSKLDPAIFQKVVSGDLRQGTAIAIGEGTSDPAEQSAILKQIEKKERKGQNVSDDRIREFIRLAQGEKKVEETTNLFGTQQVERSLLWEKSEVSEYIQQQLKKDKKLFGFVAKEGRATELARAGNKIDVEKSKEISTGAAQAEEVYNKLSARGGPIASILDEAARKLADGENAGQVKSDAYQRIREEVSKTLGEPTRGSAERPEGTPEGREDTGISLFSPETQLAPPFYSKAARIAFEKLPVSMSGESALATLKNAGVKADELKWIGLDDFLRDKPKVSKRDVLSHIMRNMVQIREVSKGVKPKPERNLVWRENHRGRWAWFDGEDQVSGAFPDETDQEDARQSISTPRDTSAAKYESYTLPGEKKNYTELLLTIPELPTQKKFDPSKVEIRRNRRSVTQGSTAIYYEGKLLASYGDDPQLQPGGEYKQKPDDYWMQVAKDVFVGGDPRNSIQSEAGGFRSSHFEEPNILAHVRFDERTDSDGKPILFVEEVQSDWHQKGKKVGYAGEKDIKALEEDIHTASKETALAYSELRPLLVKDDLGGWDRAGQAADDAYKVSKGEIGNEYSPETLAAAKKWGEAKERERRATELWQRAQHTVPDAPFKSDWHELAMKTMLRKAAEGGYDKIAWVTGEQTADRYDLSKKIEAIRYNATNGKLRFLRKAGGAMPDGVEVHESHFESIPNAVHPEELPNYIGKDAAEKIMQQQAKDGERIMSGLDLKVGGEWAKNLYDHAIPNFLSKYGKKWGAKAGETTIAGSGRTDKRVLDQILREDFGTTWADATETQREWAKERQGGTAGETKVHSLSITPEMRSSVLSEGQPLFSAATGPILPSVAKDIAFSVKPTTKDLPSYLELNGPAAEAINRALGVRVNGVNLDARDVPEIATKLKAQADKMQRIGPAGAKKLRNLANSLIQNTDKNSGLNIVRASEDQAHQLATLHEEMIHSGQRAAGGGDLEIGTPWRKALESSGMIQISIRVNRELDRAGIDASMPVIVAEGLVDIMRGDAWEITDAQAYDTARKYFEAMAEQHGIESVQRLQDIEDFISQEADKLGVTYGSQSVRQAGRQALAAVLSGSNGEAVQRTGKGAASGSASLAGRGPETRLPPRNTREEFRGSGSPHEGSTLASTQPIGLTDEELENWSKTKGFRVEPAGEQLSMFGGGEPVLRVFRSGPRGKEQTGLVYQSQIDKLNTPKQEEPLPDFALTGGDSREEQPALFGGGDLGEIIGSGSKGGGIQLPQREGKGTSLFSSDRGEADLGKLGKDALDAADTVQEYLKSSREYTAKARDLQRNLETLDTQKQADILSAVGVMKSMKKEGMDKSDDAAIYHNLENPNEKLSAAQKKWLDAVVNPIVERNEELYTQLTEGGIPIENYVHRVVKGKGGMLDRIAQGVRAIGQKATLSKSAPQTKHRTYMALEKSAERGQGNVFTRPGNRVVVSVKGGQVTAWKNGIPENIGGLSSTEEGKAFEDKDGNLWTLKQATTKEIEQHTGTRYYHSALASTLASNIQLGSAVRAMRFLNDFKNSPDFHEVAWNQTQGPAPKGWKTTSLVQFKGYAFEPRTAEVLDHYYDRMRQGNIGALDQIGKFMRVAMLLNPIMHPMNVAASWAVERGATGLLPTTYARAFKSGNKAVKAVLSQNKDFIAALDAGAPLQSHREAIKDITKLFFDQLAEGLGKEEPWAKKIAEALGIEHGNLLNILHKFSSKAAWVANDIFFLQSAYEHQAADPKMSLEDALKETGRIIPEYRVPTRILDSPLLSKLMTNRWATIFGSYHYGLLRSFGEIAKSALGAQEPPPGRTKTAEVAKGWDRLALLALVTMALYPALDEIAKKITKDKHARVKRFGPFAVVDSVSSVVNREQSVSTAAQRIITPAPQTKAAAELLMNREFYAGHQIYDPHAPFTVQTEQMGRYLLDQMGQVGQAEKAQTSEQKRRFAYGQVGVAFRKTAAEKLAADIAMSKVGTQAEDPEDQQNRVMRREILDQLRKGNEQPLRDAQVKHEISRKQVMNLERRARLTPLQDTVHGFTYKEIRRVYDAASPEEKKELQEMVHHKLMNLLHSGRREEVTTEAP